VSNAATVLDPPPSGVPFQLEEDRLLLVEGDFDLGFLRALLDRHGRKGVQVAQLDGIGSVGAKVAVRAIRPGFDKLRWLGLARDADRDARAAHQSLRDAINRASAFLPLTIPRRSWERTTSEAGRCSVTLFVFPDGEREGDFERYLWEGLTSEPAATCVEAYVSCLRDTGRTLPREWKSRVYAYLAALARPDMPLHAAGRAAELPMDSPYFQRLLDLIPSDDEPLG
jgi:hypothetical protein